MPELPEVETVRRGLEPVLVGQVITAAVCRDPRLTQPVDPAGIIDHVVGCSVIAVRRRGKYLLIDLDSGMTIEHHLRMTGSFGTYAPGDNVTHQHVRWTYEVADGTLVVYNDPRRFGTLRLETTPATDARLDTVLGDEPLGEEFTGARLHALLATSRAPVKAALLNQRLVAGLGNIYVDESLFLARVHPLTPANRVSRAKSTLLRDAIVERLTTAIDVGGSTLRDYRNVEGEVGGMQERFFVYGHSGQPCVNCGRMLVGGRVAGRGTTWCSSCQRKVR